MQEIIYSVNSRKLYRICEDIIKLHKSYKPSIGISQYESEARIEYIHISNITDKSLIEFFNMPMDNDDKQYLLTYIREAIHINIDSFIVNKYY